MSSTVPCPRCGAANIASARFCRTCGATLAAQRRPPDTTKPLPATAPPEPPQIQPAPPVAPPPAPGAPPPAASRRRGFAMAAVLAALVLLALCGIGLSAARRFGLGGIAALGAPSPTASATATRTPRPTLGETFIETATTQPDTSANDSAATNIALAQSQAATALAELQAPTAPVATSTEAAPSPTVPPSPPPTAPPPPTATPEPPAAAQLRFVKLNENDDARCISVQVKGIGTRGWRFRLDGTRIVGRFDSAGNARACGLAPKQEVTFTVFDAQGASVPGGGGVPARGSAIMRASWR